MRLLIFFTLIIVSCDLNTKKDDTISLSISSTPAGAQIYFDNVNTGFTTPRLFDDMEQQNLQVKLILNADYPEYNQTIILEEGDHKTINTAIKAFFENEWSGSQVLNSSSSFELPFGDLTIPTISNGQIQIKYLMSTLLDPIIVDARILFNGVEITKLSLSETEIIIPQSALTRGETGKLVIDNTNSSNTFVRIDQVTLTVQY